MKQIFDIDAILYRILNVDSIVNNISGDVYVNQRPDNSELEDISINTIALTQSYSPQIADSNVNIHIPDIKVKIGSNQQYKPNNLRMKEIASLVLSELRNSNVEGSKLQIFSQTVIQEAEIHQHYVNIRVSWSVHNEY